MKYLKTFLFVSLLSLSFSSPAQAIKGVLATDHDVMLLKEDLRIGKIQIGKTRLKEIRENYGEASNISHTEKKVIYIYGDLKIEFNKKRYWKDWEYDSFHQAVYTNDVNNLRSDLESDELIGENITFKKVKKDYDEPTESEETTEDGDVSIYYYGNIKMMFENHIVIKSWRGKNLDKKKK